MRIPSGKTDQSIYFFAADSTDLVTAETGLTGFTVYRSRNGGAATAYTTPTVSELSSSNMPGLYCLTIDEDTTIASGSDSEEYAVTITCTGMAPVHRVFELYRRDTTSGQTLTVTSGRGNADLTHIAAAAVSTSTAQLGVNVVNAAGTAWNSGAIGANTLATDTITAAKIAADAIGASELASDAATEIATAVWASGTRLLTAGTNIVLAKGTGVTGFNDLDASGVRSAVGLASANLDTQLSALPNSAADALLDRSAGIETGLTPRQAWRLIAAACAGKASGLATATAVYRNAVADSKDRITATVDGDGNRTAVTVDLT